MSPQTRPADYDELSLALELWREGFIDGLVGVAAATYVATGVTTSLADVKKKRVIPYELIEVGYKPGKKIDAEMIGELTEYFREKAPKYTDPYKAELMKGGRTINIPSWGEKDADGVRPYQGYERKFVPWVDNYDRIQKESIYSTITSGKSKEEISADLQAQFQMRESYANLVAQTETYNNSAIIRRDRWTENGLDSFLWVCSDEPNSPCEDTCAEFCGQIFSRDELPNDGEILHPNCKCTYMAIVSDKGGEDWANLKAEPLWAETNRGAEPYHVTFPGMSEE